MRRNPFSPGHSPDSGDVSIRVRDIEKNGGEPLTSQFSRGDTFVPVGGPHDVCKSRSMVVGYGMARRKLDAAGAPSYVVVHTTSEVTYGYYPGLLFRCLHCHGSYVISGDGSETL